MTDALIDADTNHRAVAKDMREAREKRARRSRFFKHFFLIIFAFVMVYPLLWMMASSLKPDNEIFGKLSIWPSEFIWENYSKGWVGLKVSFTKFYLNSFLVTGLSVLGNLVSCSFAAYAFARLEFTGRKLFAILASTAHFIIFHHFWGRRLRSRFCGGRYLTATAS